MDKMLVIHILASPVETARRPLLRIFLNTNDRTPDLARIPVKFIQKIF